LWQSGSPAGVIVQVQLVRLGAGGDVEFGVYVVRVVPDRVGAEELPVGDLHGRLGLWATTHDQR
jgi:hypothetical protein